MANIEILIGDTWDVAHCKIRQYLFKLFPDKTEITYDRLIALYELLDQGTWEERLVTVHRRPFFGSGTYKVNISFSSVNLTINPDLLTVEVS